MNLLEWVVLRIIGHRGDADFNRSEVTLDADCEIVLRPAISSESHSRTVARDSTNQPSRRREELTANLISSCRESVSQFDLNDGVAIPKASSILGSGMSRYSIYGSPGRSSQRIPKFKKRCVRIDPSPL